jgi:excisionase family DNA binding protein
MAERFMSINELADYLNTSKETVLKLVEQGKIPMIKTGAHYLFKETEVQAWLKRHSPAKLEDLFEKNFEERFVSIKQYAIPIRRQK